MSERGGRAARVHAIARVVTRPLLAIGLAGATVAGAQAIVPPELRQEATRLLGELATIRGLPPPGATPALVIQSREERRRFVVGEFRRKYSPARLEAERRALVAWRLVPADFDLAGFLADLLAEQAAAYYDPARKRMVLANWLTPELRRDALAHELVHVMQDRLLGLESFLAGRPGHSDEGLARQALVEGEAVALQQELRLRREGRELGQLPDVVDIQRAIRAATGPVLARAPAYVRTMLLFPYADGLGFLHAFRQRQPWSALSAIYRDPPRSASQILHPERYLDRREDPLPVELPDLAPVLPAGSFRVIEDELGELGLGEVLRRFGEEATTAVGWRGDRYALWDVPAAAPVLMSLSAWDSPAVAKEFVRTYARVLVAKHDLGPLAEGPALVWTAGPRAFLIEARARFVLIVEAAPAASLDALRSVVWSHRVLY